MAFASALPLASHSCVRSVENANCQDVFEKESIFLGLALSLLSCFVLNSGGRAYSSFWLSDVFVVVSRRGRSLDFHARSSPGKSH